MRDTIPFRAPDIGVVAKLIVTESKERFAENEHLRHKTVLNVLARSIGYPNYDALKHDEAALNKLSEKFNEAVETATQGNPDEQEILRRKLIHYRFIGRDKPNIVYTGEQFRKTKVIICTPQFDGIATSEPYILQYRRDLFQCRQTFAWGYKGTGAQLTAISLMADHFQDDDLAHENFSAGLEIVASFSNDHPFEIDSKQISMLLNTF